MIAALRRAHRGAAHNFYFDVAFEETLRQRAMRPRATEFIAQGMRGWYNPRDLLGFGDEHVVPETSSMEPTIAHIAAVANLPMTERDEDFLTPLPQP